MAGAHDGHRRRMRERFRREGLNGFADHEALELMLFYAIPQRNVNPLAHRLLDTFGSLHGVLDAPVEELQKVEGVGEYAATLLSLFSQTARRIQQSRQSQLTPVTNRGQAEAHCLALLGGLIAPLFAPLGLGDWRISTALITGFTAKESVVSTFKVLLGGSMASLSGLFTAGTALVFLVFSLLYTPCVAAIAAVKRELGRRWAFALVVSQCAIAWIFSFLMAAILRAVGMM